MAKHKMPEPVAFADPGDAEDLIGPDRLARLREGTGLVGRVIADRYTLPLYSAETVEALLAEVERLKYDAGTSASVAATVLSENKALRASIGAIHCMAGRVGAGVIRSECEHAIPELASHSCCA